MKLAFITLMGGVPYGGSEVLWTKTAKLALENGHEVGIAIYDWGKQTHPLYNELKASGARIWLRPRFSHNLPPFKKMRNYIENRIPSLKKHWQSLIRFKPDHVLINQGGCFDIIQHHYDLFHMLKDQGIPYSLLSHNHPQYSFLTEPHMLESGKSVFLGAVNNFFISKTQQKFVEKSLLVKLENASFTWNPLNLEKFELLEWPENENIQFAMVGALISGKGHDIAFESLSSQSWKNKDWKLNIYGKGDGEKYLKDYVDFLGIAEKVVFHGHVNNASEIWNKNHILLLPSSGEGLPISMMEAMVSGRPVVSTDVGGIREIIKDGDNGFLSEGPTRVSFSNAMVRAYLNRSQWKQMGVKAHKEYFNEFAIPPEKKLLEKLVE